MRPSAIVSGLLGLVLLGLSLVGLTSARDGQMRTDTVDGIPVRVYSAGDGSPTVVVAHGFAASAQMMEPLATGLQRAGFTVVTFDFPGHGANPAQLSFSGDVRTATWDQLTEPLAEVIDWAALQPEVDRTRMALLGHSMGAGAAVAYSVDDGAGDARISATTALSLPSADDVPDGEPAVPRNLLLMYGALEAPQFADAAVTALRAAYPDGYAGVSYGEAADGTARSAQSVPAVEHIGILFSPTTLDATIAWFAAALDHDPADSGIAPVLAYAALALVAGALLLVPVGVLALGDRPRRIWESEAPAARGGLVLLIALVASVLGALGAWLLAPAADVVPLAVGGYLASWFACAGAVAVTWWALRIRQPRLGPKVTTRGVVGGLIVAAVAVGVVAVPGAMSWSAFAVVGDRWWILLLMLAAFGVWFTGDELLVRRTSTGRRLALAITSRVLATLVLLAAIPLLDAPGFLILILPVLLLFLIVLAGYAAIIARRQDATVAAILVQAVPAAVLVATTFPLIG